MTPPLRSAQAPGKRASLALAIAMHVALAALLIYGIHWQTKVNDVVEVEVVRAAPTPAVKPPVPEAKLEPKPEPKREPKPAPKPEPPPPKKPDIAIKDKDKPKPPKKEQPQPKFDPFSKQLAEEEKHLALDKQIAAEEQQLAKQQQAQASAARNRAMATYSDRIWAKIRGYLVLPPDIKGNPAVLFDVVQLPSGEVISAKRIKSSGHAAYDDAVERAILRASPLPRPDDPSLYERVLHLTFCPQEDGKCT